MPNLMTIYYEPRKAAFSVLNVYFRLFSARLTKSWRKYLVKANLISKKPLLKPKGNKSKESNKVNTIVLFVKICLICLHHWSNNYFICVCAFQQNLIWPQVLLRKSIRRLSPGRTWVQRVPSFVVNFSYSSLPSLPSKIYRRCSVTVNASREVWVRNLA